MDKQTLSHYGWIIIAVLIFAVMLAFATPFGTYVGDAVVSVANGFVGASNQALDDDNIADMEEQWENKLSGKTEVIIPKPDTTTCTHTNRTTQGARAATCTEDGHTGKVVCADCGYVFGGGTIIAARGHVIDINTGICKNCGE